MQKPLIGAHVSVAGGLQNAPRKAEAIGAECMQIFPWPPQRWSGGVRNPEEIKTFNKLTKERFRPIFIHAIYLINLGAESEDNYKKSVKALAGALAIGDQINAAGVIFHAGSHQGRGYNTIHDRVVKTIDSLAEKYQTPLVIELATGHNKIGTDLSDIEQVFSTVKKPKKLGLCLDTAHAFGSGIDVSSHEVMLSFISKLNKSIGLDRLVAIHANDTPFDLGSNRDRHANIGEGKIGEKGFENLMKIKSIHRLPFIIETPGFTGSGPDEKNIQILKNIRSRS